MVRLLRFGIFCGLILLVALYFADTPDKPVRPAL